MADAVSLESLLEHSEWVRRLARQLVANAAEADDLVQEAWLTALDRRPRDPQAVRSWLGRVIRNLARQQSRSAVRRERREALRARLEAVEVSPDEVFRMHQRVVAAVDALGEPYRVLVILRWFQGMTPRAIAEREGLPVTTVRNRLHRALGMLRARLADRERDRVTWLAPLAALGGWKRSAVRTGQLATSGGMAAVVLLVGAFAWQTPGGPAPEGGSERLPREPRTAAPARPAPPVRPAPARDGAEVVASSPASVTRVGERRAILRGRVVDSDGAPVPEARIRVFVVDEPPEPIFAVSPRDLEARARHDLVAAADGTWQLESPPCRSLRVVASGRGWVHAGVHVDTLHEGRAPLVLRLRPAPLRRATVVDAEGSPRPGQEVAVVSYEGHDPDRLRPLVTFSLTDAAGRLLWDEQPGRSGALDHRRMERLLYGGSGSQSTEFWIPHRGVWHRLRPRKKRLQLPPGRRTEVTVEADTGARLPPRTSLLLRHPTGAWVARVRTDATGFGVLPALPPSPWIWVRTVDTGRDVADGVGDRQGAWVRHRGPDPELDQIRVVVRERESLRGRLVAAEDGAPLPGRRLVLHSRGRARRALAVVTDDEGHFVLPADRPFFARLTLDDPQRRLDAAARRLDFPSGAAVRAARGAFVRGRLVDPGGQPLVGARLDARASDGAAPLRACSDADGRFRLGPLSPERAVRFVVTPPDRPPLSRCLDLRPEEERNLGELVGPPGAEIRVRLLDPDGTPAAHAEVILESLTEADPPVRAIRVTDARGIACIRSLPEGPARISLGAAPIDAWSLPIDRPTHLHVPASGRRIVRIELSRIARIEGRLVFPAGTDSLDSLRLFALPTEIRPEDVARARETVPVIGRATTDRARLIVRFLSGGSGLVGRGGAFAIEVDPGRTYRLLAWSGRGRTQRVHRVGAGAPVRVEDGRLELRLGPGLRGDTAHAFVDEVVGED